MIRRHDVSLHGPIENDAGAWVRLEAEIEDARAAVGESWFAGGVSLAEAIARKCRALEDEVEGWELAARGWP